MPGLPSRRQRLSGEGLPFDAVVARHYGEVLAFVTRLGAAADAEDVTQEAFLRAFRAYPRHDPPGDMRAWLFRIAANRWRTVAGRRRWAAPLAEGLACRDGGPPDAAEWGEALAALRRCVASLPPKQRAALVLRRLHGMDYAAVAEALQCSQESARANVYQAARRLRRALEEYRS